MRPEHVTRFKIIAKDWAWLKVFNRTNQDHWTNNSIWTMEAGAAHDLQQKMNIFNNDVGELIMTMKVLSKD